MWSGGEERWWCKIDESKQVEENNKSNAELNSNYEIASSALEVLLLTETM